MLPCTLRCCWLTLTCCGYRRSRHPLRPSCCAARPTSASCVGLTRRCPRGTSHARWHRAHAAQVGCGPRPQSCTPAGTWECRQMKHLHLHIPKSNKSPHRDLAVTTTCRRNDKPSKPSQRHAVATTLPRSTRERLRFGLLAGLGQTFLVDPLQSSTQNQQVYPTSRQTQTNTIGKA